MPFLVQNPPFHTHDTAKITQNLHLADLAIVKFSKIPYVQFLES